MVARGSFKLVIKALLWVSGFFFIDGSLLRKGIPHYICLVMVLCSQHLYWCRKSIIGTLKPVSHLS